MKVKKVVVHHWCGTIKDAPYEHQSEHVDIDPFEMAKVIFGCGLNVMIYRGQGDVVILGVDTRRFQQR